MASKVTERLVKNYIIRTIKAGYCIWMVDIAERTIWGFKGSRYKNFDRAKNVISEILDEMISENSIEKDQYNEDEVPTYHKGKDFDLMY